MNPGSQTSELLLSGKTALLAADALDRSRPCGMMMLRSWSSEAPGVLASHGRLHPIAALLHGYQSTLPLGGTLLSLHITVQTPSHSL